MGINIALFGVLGAGFFLLGMAFWLGLRRLALQQSRNDALFRTKSLLRALQWRRSSSTDAYLSSNSSPPGEKRRQGSAESYVSLSPALSSSVDASEVAKFAALADTWWDFDGPFKPLHHMNPTRLSFIRSTLCRHFGRDPFCARPLEGLSIVDVGCGGGILSEPLARMGAIVTGIDAVEKNIKIASLHAGLDPQTSSIEYCCATAEKLVQDHRTFDAVISVEVIEHVKDPAAFCQSLGDLTVPGGAITISTINRSIRAYAATIIAAEYVLGWLPKGTHQWSNFVTPEELVLVMQRASISVKEMAGMVYNPLSGEWSLSDDTSVNYIACGMKTKP